MSEMIGRPLAVVTGASSGIGRALAAQFAENGYDLVVAAEDDRIEPVARTLGRNGVQAIGVQANLATFDGVEDLYQAIQEAGRPDAVALNAGVGVGGDFARDNDLADELRLIGLNVTGAVHLARRVLPDMIAAGRGGLLFTSSIAATAPGPYHATYAASKAFLLSFAEAIRYELREDHVVAGSMKNKVQAASGRVLPETAKAATQARMTEPGSGQPDRSQPDRSQPDRSQPDPDQ
jgi:short-subunit dehydrogenase